MQIKEIKTSLLKRDNKQPRQTFQERKISEMAKSILTEGVINPIEVDKDYKIITGEMRWRSAKEAGLETVPCKIINVKGKERFMRQVIENIHHNTMTPIDTAKAFMKLLRVSPGDTPGGKQPNDKGISWLSTKLGIGRTVIKEHLDLLTASQGFQQAVKDGVPYTQVRALNAVPKQFKKKLEKKIVNREFGSRDGAVKVAYALKKIPEKANDILGINYKGMDSSEVDYELRNLGLKSLSNQINEAHKPQKEVSKLIISLNRWLKDNPPESVGSLFLKDTLIGLEITKRNIEKWKGNKQIKEIPGIIEGKFVNNNK